MQVEGETPAPTRRVFKTYRKKSAEDATVQETTPLVTRSSLSPTDSSSERGILKPNELNLAQNESDEEDGEEEGDARLEDLKNKLRVGDWKAQLAMMDADEEYVPSNLKLGPSLEDDEEESGNGMPPSSPPKTPAKVQELGFIPSLSQQSVHTVTGTDVLEMQLSTSNSPLPLRTKIAGKKRRIVFSDDEEIEEEQARKSKKSRSSTQQPWSGQGETEDTADDVVTAEGEEDEELCDVGDAIIRLEKKRKRDAKKKLEDEGLEDFVIEDEGGDRNSEGSDQERDEKRGTKKSKKEPKLKKISKKDMEASRAEISRHERERRIFVPSVHNRLDPLQLVAKLRDQNQKSKATSLTVKRLVPPRPKGFKYGGGDGEASDRWDKKKEVDKLMRLEKTSSILDPEDEESGFGKKKEQRRDVDMGDGSEIEETPVLDRMKGIELELELDDDFSPIQMKNKFANPAENSMEGDDTNLPDVFDFVRTTTKLGSRSTSLAPGGLNVKEPEEDDEDLIIIPQKPKVKKESAITESQILLNARTFHGSSPITMESTVKKAKRALMTNVGRTKLSFGQDDRNVKSSSSGEGRKMNKSAKGRERHRTAVQPLEKKDLDDYLLKRIERENANIRKAKEEAYKAAPKSRAQLIKETNREWEREKDLEAAKEKRDGLKEMLERKKRERHQEDEEEDEDDGDYVPEGNGENQEGEEEEELMYDEDENIVEKSHTQESDEEGDAEDEDGGDEGDEAGVEEEVEAELEDLGVQTAIVSDDKGESIVIMDSAAPVPAPVPAPPSPIRVKQIPVAGGFSQFEIFDAPLEGNSGGLSQFFNDDFSQAVGRDVLAVVSTQEALLPPEVIPDFFPTIPISQAGKERDAMLIEEALGAFGAPKEEGPKETFINKEGFFTQTRPEDSDTDDGPIITDPLFAYEPTQTQQTQADASQEENSSPVVIRRLVRHADVPESSKVPHSGAVNAFDVLKAGARRAKNKPKDDAAKQKKRDEMAEFLDDVAMESDQENERWGLKFGGGGDDDEVDDEGDAEEVQKMMDDTAVDEETKAQQDELAAERYRQDLESDQAKLQKKVEDVVQGKQRMRQKKSDLDLDSDFSDDDFGKSTKFREKRRKITHDDRWSNITNDPAKAAFAESYNSMLAPAGDGDYNYLMEPEDNVMDGSDSDADAELKEKIFGSTKFHSRVQKRELTRRDEEHEELLQEAARRDSHLIDLGDRSSSPTAEWTTRDYYTTAQRSVSQDQSQSAIDREYGLAYRGMTVQQQQRMRELSRKNNSEELQGDGRVAGKNSAVTSFKSSKPAFSKSSTLSSKSSSSSAKATTKPSGQIKGRLGALSRKKSFR